MRFSERYERRVGQYLYCVAIRYEEEMLEKKEETKCGLRSR